MNVNQTTGVPVPVRPPQVTQGPWSTGLCDCCSDCSTCCLTCWCPCITFGQIAEIVDQGSPSCAVSGAIFALIQYTTGCAYCYSCLYRKRIKLMYNLSADFPCYDALVHHYCGPCALCQEYRELKLRGFNMNIGWQGNVDTKTQGVKMAPFPQGGMHR